MAEEIGQGTEQKLGSRGTAVHGGYIVSNETNADLQGSRRYKTFGEILVNCAILGAGVRYFLNLTSKAGWKVTPADDSEEAKEYAEFVEDVMNDMETPWARIVRRAAMYRFYGFSVQEWTAKKREDGRIGFLDIEPRPQKTIEKWELDESGEVAGCTQTVPQTGLDVFLPRWKIVYLVDDSLSDSPEGLGLFRHIAPHAKRLKTYEDLESIGFETDLRGIPVLRAPIAILRQAVKDGKMTQTQMDEALNTLKNFITNHFRSAKTGLLLDSLTYTSSDEARTPSNTTQYSIELLRGSGSTIMKEVESAIDRVNEEIARLLGVEHLLLGTQSKGSFALSRDKTNNFFLIVDSTLVELSETFEKDFLDVLWELNGFSKETKPTLSPEPVKFTDVSVIVEALARLATAGAPLDPNDPAVNEIRELLGLSRAEGRTEEDLEDESLIPTNPVPNEEEDNGPDSGDE